MEKGQRILSRDGDAGLKGLGLEVGCRLRELRERRGWSQRDLAAHLNIGQSRLAKYEAGRLPPTGVLVRLSRLSGVPLDLLVADPALDPEEAELRERLRRLLAMWTEERAAAVLLLDSVVAMWRLIQAGRSGGDQERRETCREEDPRRR